MGLVVHSDHHIDVMFWFEQFWPRINGDTIIYDQCHDLIVRSRSEFPLKQLHVLLPFMMSGIENSSEYQTLEALQCEKFNWIFKAEPKPCSDRNVNLHFVNEETEGKNSFSDYKC